LVFLNFFIYKKNFFFFFFLKLVVYIESNYILYEKIISISKYSDLGNNKKCSNNHYYKILKELLYTNSLFKYSCNKKIFLLVVIVT